MAWSHHHPDRCNEYAACCSGIEEEPWVPGCRGCANPISTRSFARRNLGPHTEEADCGSGGGGNQECFMSANTGPSSDGCAPPISVYNPEDSHWVPGEGGDQRSPMPTFPAPVIMCLLPLSSDEPPHNRTVLIIQKPATVSRPPPSPGKSQPLVALLLEEQPLVTQQPSCPWTLPLQTFSMVTHMFLCLQLLQQSWPPQSHAQRPSLPIPRSSTAELATLACHGWRCLQFPARTQGSRGTLSEQCCDHHQPPQEALAGF